MGYNELKVSTNDSSVEAISISSYLAVVRVRFAEFIEYVAMELRALELSSKRDERLNSLHIRDSFGSGSWLHREVEKL